MESSREPYCQCLFYSANALARKLTRLAEKEFEGTGLPPSYGFVLMTVNNNPGILIGDIADIVQLQPSTVTRLIDKLEKEKYLKRKTQGKFIHVFPTPKAVKLNEELKASWFNLYKKMTSVLGEEATSQLTSAISRASDKFE